MLRFVALTVGQAMEKDEMNKCGKLGGKEGR